jgi:hypothetical protein
MSACERLEGSLPESEQRVLAGLREQTRRLQATVDRMFAASAASAERISRPRWS